MTTVAVLLAGGRGRRLAPLTDECPKPLLPVAGRPLIAYALDRLASVDVTDVLISTGYLAGRFPAALGDGSRWGLRLHYVGEPSPLGTGGGLALAWQHALRLGLADHTPVLVSNADELASHRIDEQLRFFAATASQVTLHVRYAADRTGFGAIEATDDGLVTGYREKPTDAGPGLINAGCYLFWGPLLTTLLPAQRATPGPSSLERDLLPAWVASGVKITAFRDDAPGLDVGTPSGLAAAEDHLARINTTP